MNNQQIPILVYHHVYPESATELQQASFETGAGIIGERTLGAKPEEIRCPLGPEYRHGVGAQSVETDVNDELDAIGLRRIACIELCVQKQWEEQCEQLGGSFPKHDHLVALKIKGNDAGRLLGPSDLRNNHVGFS